MNFEDLYFLFESHQKDGSPGRKEPNRSNSKKNKKKPSEIEARSIITLEWLQKTKIEISRLIEAWEAPPKQLASTIKGALLGKVNGHDVYAVDGNKVMTKYDMDFVTAGNHQKWHWIPKNHFWVDKSYRMMDAAHDILHEAIEEKVMRELEWEYDDAHLFANKIEKQYIRDLIKHTGMIRRLAAGDYEVAPSVES
jgi:hypothetical protein